VSTAPSRRSRRGGDPAEQGIPGHGLLLGFAGEEVALVEISAPHKVNPGQTTAPAWGKGRGTQNAEIWPSSSVGGNVGCP
jgi:hypothetical protein